MLKLSFGAAFLALGLAALPATSAEVKLWRMDCGSIHVADLNTFSDTYAYTGKQMDLTDSCYLIQHDAAYFLWDTGLPAGLLGAKQDATAMMSPTLTADLPSQLAQIGVKPDQIAMVGISHLHFDHIGQAADFPKATLMIGAADFDALKQVPFPEAMKGATDPAFLANWLTGGGKSDPISGDRDVFGDGSVVILAMPGHTAGETALLVTLAKTGSVVLSGDVVHFAEQIDGRGLPGFNTNRADSLASLDRLVAIVKNLHATLIIQHDARDVAKLPAFPASAN